MKKLITRPKSLFIVCLLAFGLFFLPQIDRVASIQPHNQSQVKAQLPNSTEEKPGCSILYNYDKFDMFNDDINALYDRGYRLKEVAFQPIRETNFETQAYVDFDVRGFAAVCKD